jgi:DNA-binding NtrC family response regulator
MIGLAAADAARVGEAARRVGLTATARTGLTEGLAELGGVGWAATLLGLEHVDPDGTLVRRMADQTSAGALVLVGDAPSPELTMRVMAAGVHDIWLSPLDEAVVAAGLAAAGADRATGPRVALPAAGAGEGLVGGSAALLEVFKAVGRVAGSAATVLVTGESGTGKELVAQALHRLSPRAARSFVAVNCAAIPEDLLESELFGHERGAFTGAVARKVGRFERANGGTLFLDEIGDMSLVLQAKILRALQEREIERLGGDERISVDVRVVAATHRDLPARIAAGEFREDLFYRLAVVRLHLPPLRERGGDVRALALHYAAHYAAAHGRPVGHIASAALERLELHPWPGNVRELRNVMERAVLATAGDTLLPEHLQLDERRPAPAAMGEPMPGYRTDLTMAEVEALHIERVLRDADGHFGRAAAVLQMHRNTVSRKAQEYGIVASSR